MGKAAYLAATIIFAAIAVAGGLMYWVYWPKIQRQNTAVLAATVEQAIEEYRKEFGQWPAGEAKEVVAALLGQNPRAKSFLRPEFRKFLTEQGEPRDTWSRPLRMERSADGKIAFKSAGRNGTFGDADDLSSQDVVTGR